MEITDISNLYLKEGKLFVKILNDDFVQDNHSKSQKNVLRGLHFQKNYPQGKLIRVIKGKIYWVHWRNCL